MPHPDKGGQPTAATTVIADRILDTLDAVLEMHLRQPAVWRWPGHIVNPHTSAGVIDLSEEQATCFYFGSTQTRPSPHLSGHPAECRLAEPDLVSVLGIHRQTVVLPAEPPNPAGVAEAYDGGHHRLIRLSRPATGEGYNPRME